MEALKLEMMWAKVRAENRPALMAFLMAGYPTLEGSLELAEAALEAGADGIELGMPFSDPLADGPLLQAAAQKALAEGLTWKKLLAALFRWVPGIQAPVTLMSYVNPALALGFERLAEEGAAMGLAGVLIPDLPVELAGSLVRELRKRNLSYIPFLAPTSPPERWRAAGRYGTGFVYCVSVTGVTGVREGVPKDLPPFLDGVRRTLSLPVGVGFGISRGEQIRALKPYADAFIVGSALVKAMNEGNGKPEKALMQKIRELREALL